MLKTALKHHQAGEAEQAEKLYRQLLEQEPNNTDALHLLGILLAQRGKFLEAQKYIEKAIKLEPNSPSFYNSLGNVYKHLGNLNKAVSCYRKALKIDPDYAVAHNSLANVFFKQGKLDKASEHYNKALKLQPKYTDAHYNLALILLKQHKTKEALQHLDEVLRLEPDHAEAHNQKAQLLHQQGQLGQAIYHYQECLKQDPVNIEVFHNLGAIFLERRDPAAALKYFLRLLQLAPDFDTYYNLGVIYMDLGRTNDAIQYFNEALNKDPDHIATHVNLGAIYLKSENYIKAAEHYQKVLKSQPNNKESAYILSAINQEHVPEQAPKEYIQSLFDQYAPYFDKHLIEALDYQVPELLYKAIVNETEKTDLNILDLGCGTGLAGEKFRPIAKKLIGVDIAGQMIAAAKQKNIYDELYIADLYKILQKYHNLDLIIAADTFVYIGKLDKIFIACKKALASNGLFAFTTEKTDKYPYELQKSARFAHHHKYITELAEKNNFKILRGDNIIMRKQKNKSIEGYLYIDFNS